MGKRGVGGCSLEGYEDNISLVGKVLAIILSGPGAAYKVRLANKVINGIRFAIFRTHGVSATIDPHENSFVTVPDLRFRPDVEG